VSNKKLQDMSAEEIRQFLEEKGAVLKEQGSEYAKKVYEKASDLAGNAHMNISRWWNRFQEEYLTEQ